ncbi:MAG: CopG family ribbon-helix-helix protein [Gammaproteobacteria bacterium]|jgi:predicted transcriptional regulator
MASITMGVKLDDEMRGRLKALGERRRRSTHWLMKEAIRDYVEREERTEREHQLTLERWEHYQTTGKSVSHEEVEAWLDSLGTAREKPCPVHRD